MILFASAVIAVGAGLMILAALPVRMPITRRPVISAVGLALAGFGGWLLLAAISGEWAAKVSPFGCMVLIIILAALQGFGLAWRMRRNIRDWRERWRYQSPAGIITELFKRYHDID